MLGIPQSTAYLVLFKAFLASDHTTEATGKTIAITISKNGGAFGNPAAGALNATEISSGWYKAALGTGDTGTLGPLAIRGAVATIDDVGMWVLVVDAATLGATNLDAAISTRASSAALATVQADTDDIQTRLPAALVSGRIDASVGAMAANTLTATAIATDAITAGKIAADAIGASELAADAVTEIQTGLATSASISALNNLSQANVRTAVGLASANLDTQLDALPTNAELATALGTADDAVLAAIAALNNVSTSQVNAEVVDALATDTYAEPGQGAPAAITSLAAKINYLYKAWRNKQTQTATTFSLYADDTTTVDQKATVSDDGTTFTRGEVAGGP